MRNRWFLLGVFCLVRITMGISFESVPVLAPYMRADIAMSFTQLGTLVGIFLTAAAVLSLPASVAADRIGARWSIIIAIGCLALGSAIHAVAPSYGVALAGRVVCGIGGMLLQMLLAKLVVDAFAGRELATAMAILLATWPFALGMTLLSLGRLATATHWRTTMGGVAVFAALIAFAFATLYRPTTDATAKKETKKRIFLTWREGVKVTIAGIAWGLLNGGLVCYLTFTQALLVDHGMSLPAADTAVSLATLVMIPALPLAGWISDRLGRPRLPVYAACLVNSLAYVMLTKGSSPLLWAVLVGVSIGAAGPTVASLPGTVMRSEAGVIGFGIWNMISTVLQGLAPSLAGTLLDRGMSRGAALVTAAVVMALVIPAVMLLDVLQKRWGEPTPA